MNTPWLGDGMEVRRTWAASAIASLFAAARRLGVFLPSHNKIHDTQGKMGLSNMINECKMGLNLGQKYKY
jgi:hypothetical protein